MGTGYTRNDTANNIADGNVINAADFDGEYDAIEAAFNSSTGHTHDGTAAEGGPITVLGPNQEFVASASAVAPSTNAGLDIGTASLKFKDLYIDGTAYIDGLGGNLLIDTTNALQFRDTALSISSSADGQLDIAADTTAKITSPEVIVTDDFRLQSDAAILTFGADDDVSVTHVADTGLDAQAASGFTLRLQTGDTTVESGNTIGKISFNAPDEASGTDAILVGAEIEAAAEDTFSSTVNSTALVFKTNTSAAATERMRIKSDGDIVTQGANYTMTWDHSADTLRFADGAKANFGTSDDLQIYHDGTNSYISDQGTGHIKILANDFRVVNAANTEQMITADQDGAVSLYYDSVAKLATTTDGIDVTGDISVGNLNVDTNTISSTDTNGDINLSPNGTGTVVINTDLDVDNININGNSITSTDTNGDINITPNGTGKVNIAGGFVPSEINLTSTDAGATAGPIFELHRNSASPADNDAIGAIDFAGQDNVGNKVIYASIDATIMDVTDTTEDGRLDFITQIAGSNYSRMRLDPAATIFNEAGADINFRVEGDTNTNLLFIDGGNDRLKVGGNGTDGAAIMSIYDDRDNSASNWFSDRTGLELYNYSAPAGYGTSVGIFLEAHSGESTYMYSEAPSNSNVTGHIGARTSTTNNRDLIFWTPTSVTINDDGYDADFRVESNSLSHAIFLDAGTGQLTFGTSTPKTKAVFSGSSGSGSNLGDADFLIEQANTGFITVENTDDTAGVEAGIIFRAKSLVAGAWAIYCKQNGSYTGDLVFRGRTSAGSASAERMRLKGSNGRLGLNETSPTSLLHLSQPSDDTNGGLQIRNSGDNSSVFIYQEGNNTVYDEGTSGEQIFKTGSAERFRITDNGVTFNGDTAGANALSDYEEGTFSMTLSCNGGTYTLSARYCKVGQVVTITNSTANYWILAPSAAGQAVTITTSLPFTPKVSGGIACSQCRAVRSTNSRDEADGVMPVIAWRGGSATIYLDATDQEPSYEPSNRLETDSTRTNIVLNFSGSYLTDS